MKSRKQTIWMLALALVAVPLAAEAQYTFINLNPNGFINSYGQGISGGQQVGSGAGLATLWSGTAASAVDLNPSGFTASLAFGISGSQQVGGGIFLANGTQHALLWSGTAASAVDLHPSGFYSSFANGISGSQQVGGGSSHSTGGHEHALLWSGTAVSAVDLHNFLSPNYVVSYASGIDANGNIIGSASNSFTRRFDAILWVYTPSRITSILQQGNDMQIAWTTYGGTTNAVQATNGDAGGSYSNNFIDLSSPIIIPGTGLVTTNYSDSNGATNKSRFYRIRITYP